MTGPYLALSEPLSQETAPSSSRYNRKALALVALLSCMGGVALWTQLAKDEQQTSTMDMIAGVPQPVIGARPSMPMFSHPMQSAYVPQFMAPNVMARAEADAKPKPKAKAKKKPTEVPPVFSAKPWLDELEEQLKSPEKTMIKFGGGTGGLLKKASVEEVYIMTWESPKEQMFEMPMGGVAMMSAGQNMVFLARKEHCLALGTRLRSKMKINYRIFRRFPNGEVEFLHPNDGVYPEKVNFHRVGVNSASGNIDTVQPKDTTPKGAERLGSTGGNRMNEDGEWRSR